MESATKLAGIGLGAFVGASALTYGVKKYARNKALKKHNAKDLTKASNVLNRLALELPASYSSSGKMRVTKWSMALSEVYVEKANADGKGIYFMFRVEGMSETAVVNLTVANAADGAINLKHTSPEHKSCGLMIIKSAIDAVLKKDKLTTDIVAVTDSVDADGVDQLRIVKSK